MPSDLVTMEVSQASLAAFGNTLLVLQALTGKSLQEITRQQARLVAVNLAFNTQPYGLGPEARKLGQAATIRDIGRVYITVGQVFEKIKRTDENAARGFYKCIKEGNLDQARHIMRAFGLLDLEDLPIGTFDGGAMHNKLRFRNRRGRIGKATKPRLIVTDGRALAVYQRKMADRVGWAKSSFASCADQLGGSRGIPLWAKRWRAPAHVQDLTGGIDNPHVIMTSQVPFMEVILPPEMQRNALDMQRGKMQSSISRAIAYNAKRSRLAA